MLLLYPSQHQLDGAFSTTRGGPERRAIPRSMAATGASRPAPVWSRATSPGCRGAITGPGWPPSARCVRTREVAAETSTEVAYYLLSTPLRAERFAEVAHAHWDIEN